MISDSKCPKSKNWELWNFDDPEIGYRSLIDIDSFIDFFIMNEITKNIESALDYGYKYIDTAWIYGNQTYIGKALRNWQINKIGNTSKNRESIKVISKIWNNVTIKKEVKIQFEFILKELN